MELQKRNWFQSFLTFIILVGITTLLFLYTSGYRLTRKEDNSLDLSKTGMISAKSIPEGSNVYVNGVLMSATNDTISGIEPGIHNLKIQKKGFVTWAKDIEVFPELVTDITAVLVSQSPRLEPLTNTGARHAIMSSALTKLAFFSKDPENPGIHVIPLAQEGLSLFRSTASNIIKDTPRTIYSDGTNIEWSPDEKEILVETAQNIYHLVDLETNTSETTSSPETIRNKWALELSATRTDFIEKVELPEDVRKLASDPKSLWAPDDKKFLYTMTNGDNIEYHVYNMEKPIPIGEKVDNVVFTTKASDPQPKISWYSDSFHLIMVEGYSETEKRGTISLIRIDGSNKTEIYNNTLYSDEVYSTPGGDKIIILTSFKSTGQTDLYTVSIR